MRVRPGARTKTEGWAEDLDLRSGNRGELVGWIPDPPTGRTARVTVPRTAGVRGDGRAMHGSITVPDAIRPAPPPGGIGGEDQGRRPFRDHQPKGLL
jgi:hypothetical protein